MPVVQLTAADTDKDGYDELVITAGLNDTYGCQTLSRIWARRCSRTTGLVTGDADLQIRALGGRWDYWWWRCVLGEQAALPVRGASVGNVLASDDSSNGDGRRSSRRGMIDYSGNHNISINNKNLRLLHGSVRRHDRSVDRRAENFQGEYKFLHRQTHTTNTLRPLTVCTAATRSLSPLIVKFFRYQGGARPMRCSFPGNVRVGGQQRQRLPRPQVHSRCPSSNRQIHWINQDHQQAGAGRGRGHF